MLSLFSICLFSTNSIAAEIKQYDFGSLASKVTRSWEPEVALYVAKHFAVDLGYDPQGVSVTRLKAGATNNFIYLVFIDNHLKLVIKGIGSRQEAYSLLALQNYTKLPEIQNNSEAATICLSKLINYYKATNDGKIYYFAILEAAQGKELFKLMTTELLQTKDINKLKTIFFNIGRQTSELHKIIVGRERFTTPKNLISVIHDDFHPENTFYNIETGKFSLIDNDSMGETISSPRSIMREIYGIYEVPVIRWPSEKITIDILKDADPHDIASIYFELILGMASVYQDPQTAKNQFLDSIIHLNTLAISFLKAPYSEHWMSNPSDKDEQHVVDGKLSRAIYNPQLTEIYISNLTTINNDLSILRNQ